MRSGLSLPRFTRRIAALAIIGIVGVAAVGGGVYAAFGGAGQSQNLSASPINLDQGLTTSGFGIGP